MNTREIKFRAWDKPNKVMQMVGALSWLVGGLKAYGQGSNIANDNYFVDGENVVLMQYTGLHDKNGKEIYEGDVIELNDGTRQEVSIPLIFGWWNLEEMKPEVIGNIWENPELV